MEKYIADHQNPILEQKRRSESLLQRTLHEITSRALSTMLQPTCEEDLNVLNDLLLQYYNKNMKLIGLQHVKNNEMYRTGQYSMNGKGKDDIKDYQHDISEVKRQIESYLFNLQTTTKCK